MTRRQAVLAMLLATVLWSSVGIVTRQLSTQRSFEVTFWRSLFNALALLVLLSWTRGPLPLLCSVRQGGRVLLGSALAWAVMFTAFMVALTLTTVANVLVTMALAPLLSALFARLYLGYSVPARTAYASLVAGLGITWMYSSELQRGDGRHLLGTAVALAVPVAAAVNWTLLQHIWRDKGPSAPDMRPAVWLGALFSAAATLPFALPFQASQHDLVWLALLGVFQLAVPCSLVVLVARVLPAPEIALLSLLEILLGVTWVWLGAGERPSLPVFSGGALVLGALIANESVSWRRGGAR